MKYKLPKDAFGEVKLAPEHQDALIQEADSVVRETIEANEAFLESDHTFQSPDWRLVREKEGLRVYCQRRKSGRNSRRNNDPYRDESSLRNIQSTSWANSRYLGHEKSVKGGCEIGAERETALTSKSKSTSAFTENSIMERMKPSGVHLMALHGTMDGSLDDCMFGCLASTDDAWKLRSMNIGERLEDSRVLATIRGSIQEDPFRFLGIKWFTKENSSVLSSMMQQRDFLIMEASGFTRDSKGERVGYFLMHSVTILDVPELSFMGVVRGNMSFCSIFRQSRPGQLTVHSLGFFDSCGGIPSRVSVAHAADGFLSLVNVVDYAYTKKLAWMMKSKGGQFGRNTPSTSCAACAKSFKKFSLSRSGGTCRICCQMFCAKCSVAKKMIAHVSDNGTAKQSSIRFCLGCLLTAKKQSAWDITLSELYSLSEGSPIGRAQLAASYAGFRSIPQQPQPGWASQSYSSVRQQPQPGWASQSYSSVRQQPQPGWASQSYSSVRQQPGWASQSYSSARSSTRAYQQSDEVADFTRSSYLGRSNNGEKRSLSFTGAKSRTARVENAEKAMTSRGIRLRGNY